MAMFDLEQAAGCGAVLVGVVVFWAVVASAVWQFLPHIL